MFEYQKSLKEVEKIQKLIESIENNEENSSYRVEINFGNGKLYENNAEEYGVDIYVISNFKNYNSKNSIYRFQSVYGHDEEKRLPCTIIGNPIANKGVIRKIEFNKDELLKELENNKPYIKNPTLGTVEIKKRGNIEVHHLYTQYIKVYF
ncbi:hypothetical protein PYH66_13500 (plasmid) [Staphylococcus delphini]|uniref:hypothetical protein n=1 Tax=Staphylococcus delphini TaxID=53344 RepID=UPI003364FF83